MELSACKEYNITKAMDETFKLYNPWFQFLHVQNGDINTCLTGRIVEKVN